MSTDYSADTIQSSTLKRTACTDGSFLVRSCYQPLGDLRMRCEHCSCRCVAFVSSAVVICLEDTILKADSTLAKIYFLDSQNAYKLNNVTFKDMSVEFGETVVESEKDLTLDNTVLKAGGLVLNGGLFVSGESKLYSKENGFDFRERIFDFFPSDE